MRSLIEEAMASSQLEGASTTRQIAKEMLGTGRQPRDRSEQMIFNNYAMMQSLRHLQDRPLSVDRLLELHRLLMREALDDPSQAGRLRTADDTVHVPASVDPPLTHPVQPPADDRPPPPQALCAFANAS